MNLPPDLYTANQVRELDRIAINDFAIAGFTLMKRAGQVTFDIMLQTYPDIKSICVVCGSGNNGGDGYVIATLAIEFGLNVNLIQLGNKDSIKDDALLARKAYLQLGAIEHEYAIKQLKVDIIVDAIFGTGLSRDITGRWAKVINSINNQTAKVVAVDIPSGLNADTGRIQGAAIKADIAVTYIGLKAGLFTGQARDYCKKIYFDDLQIPLGVYKHLGEKTNTHLIPDNYLQNTLKHSIKPRLKCSHKGHFGHVLFVGGAAGMSGAIRLAAEASLRTGAGLVSIATDPTHANIINLSRPELMVAGIEQADALQPLIDKASVLVIGPGLGQSDWAKALFNKVLESEKPKVLDADALNLLSTLPNKNSPHNNWILTPHPKEAARLLGVSTQEVENDRYRSIKKIVKKWGGGCILKGAGSLVSGDISNGMSNQVTIRVCTAGNPGMASGGMGDVLSGIVATLLAQRAKNSCLLDILSAATQLHAQAADLAAQEGERGLLASDLFPHIRALMNPRETT